jgi:ferredoxin-2, mitochondrial
VSCLVRFIPPDGSAEIAIAALPGERLIDAAWRADQPLEGTCNGQMACSTCHVLVAAPDWAKLTPAGEEEEDMLDLTLGSTRWSRLGCQIALDGLDTLTVRIPG